jgi:hypothetical protein
MMMTWLLKVCIFFILFTELKCCIIVHTWLPKSLYYSIFFTELKWYIITRECLPIHLIVDVIWNPASSHNGPLIECVCVSSGRRCHLLAKPQPEGPFHRLIRQKIWCFFDWRIPMQFRSLCGSLGRSIPIWSVVQACFAVGHRHGVCCRVFVQFRPYTEQISCDSECCGCRGTRQHHNRRKRAFQIFVSLHSHILSHVSLGIANGRIECDNTRIDTEYSVWKYMKKQFF